MNPISVLARGRTRKVASKEVDELSLRRRAREEFFYGLLWAELNTRSPAGRSGVI